MKIKSYKDGNEVKKYVTSGGEQKAALGAILGVAGAVSDIVGGFIDYSTGKKEARAREQEIANLRASAPSLETPAAFRQATKDAYDRTLLESQQREINRQLGTSVGALQQAGGRALLGGIGAATQQAAIAGQAAAGAQAKTQLEALSQLGRAELQSQQLKERRYQTELAAQRQMKQQAEQAAGAGLGTAIAGIGGAGILGTGLLGGFGEEVQDSLLFDGRNINKDDLLTIGDVAPEGTVDLKKKTPKVILEKGGVTKTKGEFSHETNPIDLVQNGQKVGEATGGEYIFNPEQSKKMKKLAEEASNARSESQRGKAAFGLAKFVKKLLRRFENDSK